MKKGQKKMENGKWKMDNEEERMDKGQERMENGKWTMDNEEGGMGTGIWSELTERGMNDLFIECSKTLGVNLNYQDFKHVLNSGIVPEVNPLREYILGLPEWDGVDYIGEVAGMVRTENGKWTMENGQLTMDNGSADGNGQPAMLDTQFDAVVLATGTPVARDLRIPGRELKGVHFALELLSQQNRVLAGIEFPKAERISARGKDVLVIGGGDTGSDCIGTAHRQGARSVTQIEIMPRPVEGPDDPQNPWPNYPRTLKNTSSHEEGCTRRWNINSLEFLGENGHLTGVRVQEIDWQPNPAGGRPIMVPKGEPFVIKAELCLLAMGFLKPEHPQYPANVFVCGDAQNGASLVVRAMASGIETARKVDASLSGSYQL
jgi:glutamate synthase (NADPH/NADH) small chain